MLEQLGAANEVAEGVVLDVAEIPEGEPFAGSVSELAGEGDRSLEMLSPRDARPDGTDGFQPSQVAQSRREALQVLPCLRELDALLQQSTGVLGRALHGGKEPGAVHGLQATRCVGGTRCQEPVEPVPSFPHHAASEPVADEVGREAQPESRIFFLGPRERGPEVVEFLVQAPQPLGLPSAAQCTFPLLGESEVVLSVTSPDPRRLTCLAQPLSGVLTDGLEDPVPCPAARAVAGVDQGLVHEA